jgi:hypothetical protein
MTVPLCPAQRRAHDKLRQLLPRGNVFALSARTGAGCTTIPRLLQEQTGGALLIVFAP